jgi:hypothetical protein
VRPTLLPLPEGADQEALTAVASRLNATVLNKSSAQLATAATSLPESLPNRAIVRTVLERTSRLLVEIAPEHVAAAEKAGLTLIGEATRDPYLDISHNGTTLIDSPIDQLKPLWKDGLVKYC